MVLLRRLFPLLALSACLADAPSFDLIMHGSVADVAAAISAQGKTLIVVDHRAAGESVGVAMRGVTAEQAAAELAKVKDLAVQPLAGGAGWMLYWAGQGRGITPVSTLIPLRHVRARDVAGWFGKPWIEQRGGQMVTVVPDPKEGNGQVLLTAPAGISVMVGNDLVNALVVTGQPRAVEALKSTVAMLDVAPARLRIDVQVYDLALADLDALGQGWAPQGGDNAPIPLEGLKPEVLQGVATKGRLLGRAHLDTVNDDAARMAFSTTVAASGTGAPPPEAKDTPPPPGGWPLSYDVLVRARLTGSAEEPRVTMSLLVQASRVRSVLMDPVKGIWPFTTSTQFSTQLRLRPGATVGVLGPDFRDAAPGEPGRDRAQVVLLTPTVLDPSEATMVSAPDLAPAARATPPTSPAAARPGAVNGLEQYRVVREVDEIRGRVPCRYLQPSAIAALVGGGAVNVTADGKEILIPPAPIDAACLDADSWQLSSRPRPAGPGQGAGPVLAKPDGVLEVVAHEATRSLVQRSQQAACDWLPAFAEFFDHPGAGVDLEVEWLRLTPAEAAQVTWEFAEAAARGGRPADGFLQCSRLDQAALDQMLKRWDCPVLGPQVLASEQGCPAVVTVDRAKPKPAHAALLAGTWGAENAGVTIGLWVQANRSSAAFTCTVKRGQSLLIRSAELGSDDLDRLTGNPTEGPKNEPSQLILVLTPLTSAR